MGHTVVVEGVWLFSNPTRWNPVCFWPSLVCKLDEHRRTGERFLLTNSLGTKFRQKFGVWSKELSKCFSKLVKSLTLCQQLWSNLKIFRMDVQIASTTPSKSNQLQSVNTARWDSWNVTTQPWEINDRKSEVAAFVVNAGMNVTTNKSKKEVSLAEVFALSNCCSAGYISGICFLKFRVIDGENIVKISRSIVKHIYEVKKTFRFVKVRHKVPLITI